MDVSHRDFAYIVPDAAQLLADANVKLIGIDYISVEQIEAPAPKRKGFYLVKELRLSRACCSPTWLPAIATRLFADQSSRT